MRLNNGIWHLFQRTTSKYSRTEASQRSNSSALQWNLRPKETAFSSTPWDSIFVNDFSFLIPSAGIQNQPHLEILLDKVHGLRFNPIRSRPIRSQESRFWDRFFSILSEMSFVLNVITFSPLWFSESLKSRSEYPTGVCEIKIGFCGHYCFNWREYSGSSSSHVRGNKPGICRSFCIVLLMGRLLFENIESQASNAFRMLTQQWDSCRSVR
jgi:hypothetical protein